MMSKPGIQNLCLTCLVGALLLHSTSSAQNPLSHRLVSHQTIHCSECVVADVDGDNWDDLVILGDPEEGTRANIIAHSLGSVSTRPIRQINLQDDVVAINAADLDHDGRAEILAIARSGDEVWLEIHHIGEDERRVRGDALALPDRDKSGCWAGVIGIDAFADLDEDGVLDVIGKVNAGFDREPRVLVGFSGSTGNLIREYQIPGGPGRIRVCEVPHPDGPFLVVSTSAPDNGVSNDLFNDSNYYLLVLNREFELEWSLRTAGYHDSMEMETADFDSDGESEVVLTLVDEDATNDQRHRLEIRDVLTGTLERYTFLPCNLSSLLFGDLDRNTIPEILAGLYDGAIWAYDSMLQRILEYEEESEQTSPRWVGDLTGDGEPEIIAQQGANVAVVLDSQLQPIAKRDFDSVLRLPGGIHAGTSRAHLLASTKQDLHLIRVAPMTPSSTPAATGFLLLGGLILFALGGIGGVGGLLLYRRSKVSRARDDQTRVMQGELLSDLSAFGHSGLAGVNLMRLAQYAEAPRSSDDPRRADYEQRLSSILHTYLDVTHNLLTRIQERAMRIPGLKQKADGMKEPMHRLETLIRRNQLPERISRVSPEVLATCAHESRVIHQWIKEIRTSVMEGYRSDVAEVALRVLAAKRPILGSNDISSSVSVAGESLARIDEEDLTTCLEIVVQNAVEAMMQTDSRALRMSIANEDGAIVVRVADTGCGIRSEDRDTIFESGVSAHGTGRGFGLFHARQTLARFSGSIRVQESKPDQGTVMAIRIPAVPSPVGNDAPARQTSKEEVTA